MKQEHPSKEMLTSRLVAKTDAQEYQRLLLADLEDFQMALVRGTRELRMLQSMFGDSLELLESQNDLQHLSGMMYLVKLKRPIKVEKKVSRASFDNWSYSLTVNFDDGY